MKAIVAEKAGGPEVLKIRDVPRPIPEPGWVSIRVMAFGLNRAELFTRQGHSPGIKFPRILGIECVGVVEEAPGTRYRKGQQIAAINYRRLLENNSAEALRRQARDKRFDQSVRRAIENKTPLRAEQIDRMVARYADRLVKQRAATIARTEALRGP